MYRRFAASAALAVTLGLVACSDQPQEASPAADYLKEVKPGGGSSTDCDFSSLQAFITGYFPGPQQSGIFSIKSSMESTGDSLARVGFGYQIMDSIGLRSRTTSLTSTELTAGADLTRGLIQCMFDAGNATEFPGYPGADVYDFERALDAAAGGVYYVRRATQDAAPVLSVQAGPPQNTLSGVAPQQGSTWNDVLNEAALFYGWSIPETNEFEWATIRPTVVFDSPAVIALCVGSVPENTLVHESNIGFLGWQGFGGYICGATYNPALTMLESGWGPRALARRLARWGSDALLPEPAYAAALLTVGGTGGAKTLRSKLKLDGVTGDITLTLDIPPRATEKRNVEFTIRVRATDENGVGVNGLCVLASGFNNNGNPATLNGVSNCAAGTLTSKQMARLTETAFLSSSNPEAGYATFRITVPSSGALIITFSGFNETSDNLTKTVTGTTTSKFNVKP